MTPTKRFFEYIIPGVPILALWNLVIAPLLSSYLSNSMLAYPSSPRGGVFLALLGLHCNYWFQFMMALALPGAFVGLPITIPIHRLLERHTEIFSLVRMWMVLTTPFFLWPAGWFAGRGWDAFLAKEHCRKWMTIVGSILCIGFGTFGIGGLATSEFDKDRWESVGLWGGAILWTVIFGVFPANWWRLRKKRSKTKLLA